MRQLLKNFVWILIICSFAWLGVDLLSDINTFLFFIMSLIIMFISFVIPKYFLRQVIFYISLFMLSNVLISSYAFIGFIILVLLMLALFQTKNGNKLLWLHEATVHPFRNQKQYIGVKVVRPQIEQRSLIYKQSLMKQNQNQHIYEWNDINIVSFGGDSIIDLGATLLPEGESIILIRKLFGRVRIIVPHNIGLVLNISLIKGNVVYEQDVFPLLNDNFHWKSLDYSQSNRRVRVVVSSLVGDVEVIRL